MNDEEKELTLKISKQRLNDIPKIMKELYEEKKRLRLLIRKIEQGIGE